MMIVRKRIIVYGVILALILGFIWGNSILSREVSGAISHFIADILGGEQGSDDGGHYLVRKAAHFLEFAALGIVFQLFIREMTKDGVRRTLASSLVGVSVPLVDETLQIFSDRGYALSDVWIDISGYAVGVALCLLALGAVKLLIQRRKKNRI